MNTFFKEEIPRNDTFKAYVREHDCCKCGASADDPTVEMQSHHIKPGRPKCSDYETVPLCAVCHNECHNGYTRGTAKFFHDAGINPYEVAIKIVQSYFIELLNGAAETIKALKAKNKA